MPRKKGMKIRIMTIKDFDGVYNLWKEAGLSVADLKTEKEQTSQMIKFNPRSNLVAIKGEKIIGSAFGVFNGMRGWIYHLAVHPDFQKKGIGSLLLKQTEEALKKIGATRVCLWVNKLNLKVLTFYEKYGYTEINDAISMGKNL